ncbi:MAG: DUF748 domain-containing protein [Rhodocyclaceae bacterium]|nr:DUF748 domain-containing protein [Rhodocyclaceae bacterium]
MKRFPRWALASCLLLLFLIVGAAVALHFAGKTLKAHIEQALGEDSSVGDISLGLYSVTISDLRIRAPAGWPAEENLHARRIVVAPDWQALLSRKIAIRYIHAEDVYLSMQRDADGHLRVLPSLLERKKAAGDDAPPPEVTIDEVTLSDAALDFYDATIRKPPYRIRLEKVEARLGKLHFPALDGRSPLELSGIIKGERSDGSYRLKGDIELATRDSSLLTTMRNVDLTALRPYLVRSAETGVRRGELDLDLKSVVKQRRLNAQGTLVLHDLVLDDSGSFMGLPRQGAVNMLKNGRKDIRMQFALQGNLDDPKFSLNENLAMKFSAGLAETLGVSIGNLGKSVGGAATGIGNAIKGLFGR